MQWQDEAVVIGARPHGESSLVLQLLTRERGRHAGLARSARRPKGRGSYEIGNRVLAHWQARLPEHLGQLRCELVKSAAALLIDDAPRLACLAAAAAVAEAALPEGESVPRVYAGFIELLDALCADRLWARRYVEWELTLLAELGFGLDLSRCAATGTREDLVYVSPRSAQAVSRAAGAPYRERLLPLPAFLRDVAAAATLDAIREGLRLTGFFLERHVLTPLGHAPPPARLRFVDRITQAATISGIEPSPSTD